MSNKLQLIKERDDVNGVLKTKCENVCDPKSRLDQLGEMKIIMIQEKGVGIASNQVGLTDSMFIYTMNNGRIEYVINPEIIKLGKRQTTMKEGCLSYPNKRVYVKRPVEIKVRYHNGAEVVTKNLRGMEARVWLHEYDHCEGECIVSK